MKDDIVIRLISVNGTEPSVCEFDSYLASINSKGKFTATFRIFYLFFLNVMLACIILEIFLHMFYSILKVLSFDYSLIFFKAMAHFWRFFEKLSLL